MRFDINDWIILISSLIIISYVFNIISRFLKIPSVLFVIGTGMGLKLAIEYFGYNIIFPALILQLMGTIGLILIVLEGALELKLKKEELPLIRKAFFAALLILFGTSFSIGLVIKFWLGITYKTALINSIPLGVISSAIAIPTVSNLSKTVKDFIIYESTFSDILGILFFNYIIQDNPFNIEAVGLFGLNIFIIIFISLIASLILMFLINKIQEHIKFFLILSILILTYTIGKIFHLPSLLMILIFGLLLSNAGFLTKQFGEKYFPSLKMKEELGGFHQLISETAFVIRTFFFILFGYSIALNELYDMRIIISGSLIFIILISIRYIYLKYTVRISDRMKKLFLAPRGLITIILFYSIPSQYVIPELSIGIVFFVIIISAILMTISLWSDSSELISDSENNTTKDF